MKGKVKKQKFYTGEGLAPAAPMSARLCALLKQTYAIQHKIRVLFSSSPAPPLRRGSGTTSPLTGEQNFYFVELLFLCAPRLAPASRWFGTAGRSLLVNPLRGGAPPILWGVLTALSYVGFPPAAAAPRVPRHSRGALPHGRASVDSTGVLTSNGKIVDFP